MVKSMTGFGRATVTMNGREITAELKAVNHRYFEFSTKLPRSLQFLDDQLKAMVQKEVARGKTELYVSVQNSAGLRANVTLSQELAGSYLAELRAFGRANSLEDDITLAAIARLPEVFSMSKMDEEDGIEEDIAAVVLQAIQNFVSMRTVEGKRLCDDVSARLNTIESFVASVEERSPETVAAYRARLETKMAEVLSSSQIDDSRIVTEAAIFAERVAVDEETVRLRSHLQQLRDILASGDAVGRKLDFLVQEINREVNTIGSKAQNLEITRIVVEMKSEVEKIREQIQNME